MTQPAVGLVQAQDSTLVILDMQTQAAAALQSSDFARVCRTVVTTVRAAEILSVPIIYSEHYAPAAGVTDPRVKQVLPESAFRVQKSTHCAWSDDGFANAVEIAARRQVVICGLQAHIGVMQTAIGMAGEDYQVFVVADGTSSHDPTLAAIAIERMRASAVTITSCESLLYEWLEGGDPASREHILSVLQES
ncbi:MAG: isochorismatase family protein [Gammaproteobacteria bacterium]|nr:isochorismatase family protein [Gammaproteobacteria bacterium]